MNVSQTLIDLIAMTIIFQKSSDYGKERNRSDTNLVARNISHV